MKTLLQVYFGNRIALLRKDKHLTQEALADACDLDRSYLSSLETGKRNPSLSTISKLAKALGIHMKEIFG
ncbi:helix-turn-helix transcriptional regulator [Erwinia billingiae]|uniref:helix-turn-helix domain-containing protein n=1 Tax=Erwinia TaxID=551 RepID=UPI0010712322|nr:helix-turn-helix transcriptional regulator [Erwinia sp. QL-Z3]QBR52729.1 XRE family transcriptional regulator [Erwinia sp. QL-Z3]